MPSGLKLARPGRKELTRTRSPRCRYATPAGRLSAPARTYNTTLRTFVHRVRLKTAPESLCTGVGPPWVCVPAAARARECAQCTELGGEGVLLRVGLAVKGSTHVRGCACMHTVPWIIPILQFRSSLRSVPSGRCPGHPRIHCGCPTLTGQSQTLLFICTFECDLEIQLWSESVFKFRLRAGGCRHPGRDWLRVARRPARASHCPSGVTGLRKPEVAAAGLGPSCPA